MKSFIQELHSDHVAELKALSAIQRIFDLISEAYPVIPGTSKVVLVKKCLKELATEGKQAPGVCWR